MTLLIARFQSVNHRTGGYGPYRETRIPGVWFSTFGAMGGHARLFGTKKVTTSRRKHPWEGFVIYSYNKGPTSEWSDRYVYFLIPGILALIYEDTDGGRLKTCSKQTGWFLRFARIEFKCIHGGFSIAFHKPETFR